MTSISRVTNVIVPDEFDFLALVQLMWQQKKIIAFCALVFSLSGLFYAYSVPTEYSVSTILRPAALNDLDALNRSEVYSLPPGDALIRVATALDSYETRMGYFRLNKELRTAFEQPGQTAEQAFEAFNRNALKSVQPDPKKAGLLTSFIGLEMRYTQGLKGEEVLNGLVQYAIESERSKIADDLKVIVSNRRNEVDAKLTAARADYESTKAGQIAELIEADQLKRAMLQDELKALRVHLKLRREDRISYLNEAVSIARTLGLKKPATPSSLSDQEVSGNVIRTEVNNQQIPLYFLGVDALAAERDALFNRKSDDFSDPRVAQIRKELLLLERNRQVDLLLQREHEDVFLKGVESLRAERSRLDLIGTDMSQLRLVNIDRPAVAPANPVGPKKVIIVLLAMLVGALLGMVIVIFRNSVVMKRIRVAHLPASSIPQVSSST